MHFTKNLDWSPCKIAAKFLMYRISLPLTRSNWHFISNCWAIEPNPYSIVGFQIVTCNFYHRWYLRRIEHPKRFKVVTKYNATASHRQFDKLKFRTQMRVRTRPQLRNSGWVAAIHQSQVAFWKWYCVN